MKHLKSISSSAPKRAAAWQDSICILAGAVVGFLGFLGGESPALLYVEDKCLIPQPNEGGTD